MPTSAPTESSSTSDPTSAPDPTSDWTPTDDTQAIHGQDTVPVPHDLPVSHDVPVPPAPTPPATAGAGPAGADLSALPPPFLPPYAVGPGGQAAPGQLGGLSGQGQLPGTNGLAIAALCCGLAAVVPVVGVVAIVLGVVALHQLRQVRQAPQVHGSGQRGRGMAIAGIVLGTIGTLVWAGLLALGIISAVSGTSQGTSSSATAAPGGSAGKPEIFVDDLEAGDCFSGGRTDQIDLVNPVPCTSAHESQVVTIFELPEGDYPGEDEVIAAAEEGCADKADPLLTDAAFGDLEPSFIYPDSYTWRGDRTVLCLVEAPTGTTTGSALK
ncbi:DUF4190 domain-containing protein [Humibacillus xanthopallidus]|uniref:DUF4190 domain-containing protein n=1 Tax=Humibacillus xanthopallidus TaxID=412689 RepID=UPI0038502D53